MSATRLQTNYRPIMPVAHRLLAATGIGVGGAAGLIAAGTAFVFYAATVATTYTWANDGADGGDLLAAAATGGIAHPPGYPLYTLLLRALLKSGAFFLPMLEPATLGNLFSAGAAAGAVALTTAALTTTTLTPAAMTASPHSGNRGNHLLGALAAGLAFGTTPLLWSQAVITEVYALHALWIAGLGWVVATRAAPLWMALLIGCGLAHHLTFALLLPAALYAWAGARYGYFPGLFPADRGRANKAKVLYFGLLTAIGGGLAVALLFYLRLPWVAGWFSLGAHPTPAPVLWGYPDNWTGLWWLISGAPYHEFVFGVPPAQWPGRIAAALAILVQQYTLAGALLALWGLFRLGAASSPARHALLLWIVPTLLYAITYNTTDSYVYLLPIVWAMAIGLAGGGLHLLNTIGPAIKPIIKPETQQRFGLWIMYAPALLLCMLVLALALVRLPGQNLRQENAARQYIENAMAVITPHSLLVTSTDAHTFALWYAAWGTGELTAAAPGVIPINIELYEHAWYQRVLRERYPALEAVGAPFPTFLRQNAQARTIWLSEPFAGRLPGSTRAEGVLWQYVPDLAEE